MHSISSASVSSAVGGGISGGVWGKARSAGKCCGGGQGLFGIPARWLGGGMLGCLGRPNRGSGGGFGGSGGIDRLGGRRPGVFGLPLPLPFQAGFGLAVGLGRSLMIFGWAFPLAADSAAARSCLVQPPASAPSPAWARACTLCSSAALAWSLRRCPGVCLLSSPCFQMLSAASAARGG